MKVFCPIPSVCQMFHIFFEDFFSVHVICKNVHLSIRQQQSRAANVLVYDCKNRGKISCEYSSFPLIEIPPQRLQYFSTLSSFFFPLQKRYSYFATKKKSQKSGYTLTFQGCQYLMEKLDLKFKIIIIP